MPGVSGGIPVALPQFSRGVRGEGVPGACAGGDHRAGRDEPRRRVGRRARGGCVGELPGRADVLPRQQQVGAGAARGARLRCWPHRGRQFSRAAPAERHRAGPGLAAPQLIVEPGRAIVARAAVALYTVGSSKEVPGVKTFVSVDGGMGDNVRPALYESRYSALVANRVNDERRETLTIAGKYCESGDVLLADAELPPLDAGDILAMPAAGAYALAMASNYNLSLRPAVVLVKDGQAKLMRRRETYDDVMRADVWPLE